MKNIWEWETLKKWLGGHVHSHQFLISWLRLWFNARTGAWIPASKLWYENFWLYPVILGWYTLLAIELDPMLEKLIYLTYDCIHSWIQSFITNIIWISTLCLWLDENDKHIQTFTSKYAYINRPRKFRCMCNGYKHIGGAWDRSAGVAVGHLPCNWLT